jgi:hypothetical protein
VNLILATLRSVLAWRGSWNLWTDYFFKFQIFILATVIRRYRISGLREQDCIDKIVSFLYTDHNRDVIYSKPSSKNNAKYSAFRFGGSRSAKSYVKQYLVLPKAVCRPNTNLYWYL